MLAVCVMACGPNVATAPHCSGVNVPLVNELGPEKLAVANAFIYPVTDKVPQTVAFDVVDDGEVESAPVSVSPVHVRLCRLVVPVTVTLVALTD